MILPHTRTLVASIAALALSGCDGFISDADLPADAALPECDPDRPRFCDDGRVSTCGPDGRIEAASLNCSAGWICAEGQGEAGCVFEGLEPCAADRCAADGSTLSQCGPTGHVVFRIECGGGKVCAEGPAGADCVQPELEPCGGDACTPDGAAMVSCGRSGFVRHRERCGERAICVAEGDAIGCVADPPTPCGPRRRLCGEADGAAIFETRCNDRLGLEAPPVRLADCDADAEVCVERAGRVDCGLTELIDCAVDAQELISGMVYAEGPAPVVCHDGDVVRCGEHGLLALATRCAREARCQTHDFSDGLLGACEPLDP